MRSERFRRIVETLSRRQPDLTVVMENVHKTRNLGAIARTCDAVGIGRIHAVAPAHEPLNLGHKTAGGTRKWLDVERHETCGKAYIRLRKQGLSIVAADVSGETSDFRALDYVRPTALVIGSELDGLSREAAADADVCIQVPLMGMVESLNVSVAVGVILYEAARQREIAGCYAQRRIGDLEFRRKVFEWLHPTVADFCRTHGRDYPELDDEGEIVGLVTENSREGFASLAGVSGKFRI